jgi:hypothetical protein
VRELRAFSHGSERNGTKWISCSVGLGARLGGPMVEVGIDKPAHTASDSPTLPRCTFSRCPSFLFTRSRMLFHNSFIFVPIPCSRKQLAVWGYSSHLFSRHRGRHSLPVPPSPDIVAWAWHSEDHLQWEVAKRLSRSQSLDPGHVRKWGEWNQSRNLFFHSKRCAFYWNPTLLPFV